MKKTREELELMAAARIELYRRQSLAGDFWSHCLYADYKFFSKRAAILKDVAALLQKVYDAYKDGEVMSVAISLPPRSGKCVHPDTIIYTPNAPIKIKDINVGQEVISYEDGIRKIETVVGISKSIKKQVKIEYATGESIIISPEHRLLTDTGYKESKNITDADFLIGYSSDKQDSSIEIPIDELKFISYMIFDGHCGLKTASFTKLDRDTLDEFIGICNRLNIRPVESIKQGTKAKSIWLRKKYSNGVSVAHELMEKYGIHGHLSYTKRLPESFFSLPNYQKWEFINIMFQTDGWFDGRCGAITLANEELIEDIKYVCNSLGLKTSKTKKYSKQFDSYSWTLSFGRSQVQILLDNCALGKNRIKAEKLVEKTGFSFLETYPNWIKKEFGLKEQRDLNLDNRKNISKDKFDRLRAINPSIEKYMMDDFYYMKIRSIEYIDEEIEMYDIQTTGVNNFVANGIVSHNSYIISVFCSFMLGHWPTKSVMRNSCTATLYEKLSKDVRTIVAGEKWQDMFGVPLETKGVKSWALKGAEQGTSYFGAGTGGSIIGIGASMLDVSDDLYKGWEEASSDTINDKTIGWADGARGSRQEKGCCQIDIGTRWRKKDVIGTNEERGIYGENIIRIPALIDGKSFCEDVQTTEHYLREKQNIAEEIWESEYMQNPLDIKGRLFSYDDIQWFEKIPDHDISANFGVCDSADTGRDNLSFPMCKKIRDKYYIYDWLFTTENMDITAPLIKGSIQTNALQHVRFESNNGGKQFAKDIAKQTPGCSITWRPTSSNKETRILMDAAWIKQHCVFRRQRLDKEGNAIMDEYHKAMQQVLSYVKGVTNQKDDAPDSLSMLRRFIEELGLNYVVDNDGTEWESLPISYSNVRV